MPFCNSCGSQVDAGVKFCPGCGQAMAGGSAGASPSMGGSVGGGGAVTAAANDNLMGALAYLLIPAIIFLIIEPYNRNRFVRFHSFQSLFFCLASVVLQVALGVLSSVLAVVGIGFLVAMVMPLVSLALFVVWIILVVKAFQGTQYRLPLIGDWAAKQV